MSYYKTENSEEQISEAIQNLRREIAKEYSRKENGNIEYISNKEQLRAQILPTLKVKLNLKDKIFHSSQRKYELSQLARKKAELRQKNEDLISANPRVQLSKNIKDSLSSHGLDGASVTVFAIEQLLQEPTKMQISNYASLTRFNIDLNKAHVGITKLKKANDISAQDFQLKSSNLSEQFYTNYNKYMYSDDIVSKSIAQFGENSPAVAKLSDINNEIVEEMQNASNNVLILQSEILDELDKCGITTGLDTGFQTFWKNFKGNAKKLFNKLFHRNNDEILQLNTSTKSNTRKERFYSELQNFEPVKHSNVQSQNFEYGTHDIVQSNKTEHTDSFENDK